MLDVFGLGLIFLKNITMNNNTRQATPRRRFGSRIARAFRRYIGKNTVTGNKVYRGPRGGLYTANGTPVYNFNGTYSTNKNFNMNLYLNMERRRHA
jgi:hypothetical protein